MRLPRCGPDRPPRGVAGPSTRPGVAGLLASASPEDWQSRSGGAARDADREWYLPDHCGLTVSGWCADPHLPRVDVWRSSASAYVGVPLSGGQLAGRLSCKRQITLVVIGISPVCQRLPGNSHTLGFPRKPRQCRLSSSSNFGLSKTSRSLRPLPPWT
jgi:hypothetical protein